MDTHGASWDADEEFMVEAIVGTKVSAGVKEDGFRKGLLLYQVVWKDYPSDLATWEPAENIHDEIKIAPPLRRPCSTNLRLGPPHLL